LQPSWLPWLTENSLSALPVPSAIKPTPSRRPKPWRPRFTSASIAARPLRWKSRWWHRHQV